jgi:hypothetical protein
MVALQLGKDKKETTTTRRVAWRAEIKDSTFPVSQASAGRVGIDWQRG